MSHVSQMSPSVPNIPCVPKKQSPTECDGQHMGDLSHLLTLITKAIDTTSISYKYLCCGRGDTASFCLQKTVTFLVHLKM